MIVHALVVALSMATPIAAQSQVLIMNYCQPGTHECLGPDGEIVMPGQWGKKEPACVAYYPDGAKNLTRVACERELSPPVVHGDFWQDQP